MAGNANSGRQIRTVDDFKMLEIERRHLGGESLSKLAVEYGVSKGCLSKRGLAERCREIRDAAEQLLAAEQRYEGMPVGMRVATRQLVDELKAVSMHMVTAAKYGSMTASRMNQIAHAQANKIDLEALGEDELENTHQVMRSIAAFTELANKAATIPLGLLSANKEMMKKPWEDNVIDITPKLIPEDPVEAGRAYQRMLSGE